MKVTKFGGRSLADAAQLKKVLEIIKADSERRFIIVSAPGKRDDKDIKVTDLLIRYCEAFLEKKETHSIESLIISRFKEISDNLQLTSSLPIISDYISSLKETTYKDKEKISDLFKSSGENCHAMLVAEFLTKNNLPATYVHPKDAGLLVEDIPGDAVIKKESYEKIKLLTDMDTIAVIPGFFGVTENDDICTFSRGGSDVTGAIISAGIKADLYENFTDVDAIYAANPKLIENCQAIESLTFREMRELSYAGFNVLHDEALIPAFYADIPVVIKNTNNPNSPGTLISSMGALNKRVVTGIAADSGFSSIYLSKYLMNRELGFGFNVLKILTDFHLQYDHMPSGIDDITIILRKKQLTPEILLALSKRLKEELELDDLIIKHDISMIAVVGEGMVNSVGAAATATKALADKHINLEMINQGASEVSIIVAIDEKQEDEAIKALYHAFFKSNQ